MKQQSSANPTIQYVFVLMLENRAFDHMLGFSGLTGRNAENLSEQTQVNGITDQANSYLGVSYPATKGADYMMPYDPGHEFKDVVEQLAGTGASYPSGGPYPPIDNSGFVVNYATTTSQDEGGATTNFGEIMKCYLSSLQNDIVPCQLPILTTLASEFAVCDAWFSALPGPTWPNRFFAHAASSGGLDHSPTTGEILCWEKFWGYTFPNGSIYNTLNNATPAIDWCIFDGANYPLSGKYPNVTAIAGVSYIFDTLDFSQFSNWLNSSPYPYSYTFIEPNYGDVYDETYVGGQSQHPMDNAANGELFIKQVYEQLRASAIWEQSMLIVTYDEHGGFYDHVTPPAGIDPGDGSSNVNNAYNQNGFQFDQLGVRVPAVVISAYTPKNIIDHRIYDHSSIPATVEAIFGLSSLTDRDEQALNLTSLASLAEARKDTPLTLPQPVGATPEKMAAVAARKLPFDPNASIDKGNMPGFLHLVVKAELQLANTPEEKALIIARYKTIRTKGQAKAYVEEVSPKIEAARKLLSKKGTRNLQ